MFLERLKNKIQKENLWFFILLLLNGKPRYGYELRRLIKENFGFWSGNVTAYRVLYSLEKYGYIESEKRGERRYYEITRDGKKVTRDAIKFIENLARDAKSF